jgi:hypothetical protein
LQGFDSTIKAFVVQIGFTNRTGDRDDFELFDRRGEDVTHGLSAFFGERLYL